MTPKQQQIAIAKACGWTEINSSHHKTVLSGIPPAKSALAQLGRCSVPEYPSDLNAMHKAEKVAGFHENTAKGRKLTQKYARSLGYSTESWKGYATASQRAEAFLRTLNLWTS